MTDRIFHGLRVRILALAIMTAVFAAYDVAAQPGDAAESSAPKPYHGMRSRGPLPRATALADRVRLMATELDLDSSQQQQLTAILIAQQGEVAKAWSDPSVPAALRINATQRISERTGDRIRAMLTDAQREKYIKVHPHDTPVGAPGVDLDKWMSPAAPNAH
jgi:hypothetical protein